jgi:hypothetical protein
MTLSAGIRHAASVVCAAVLVSGCAVRSFTLPEGPAVDVSDVPFHPQTEYQCGPAALATVLGHSGVSITPEALVPQVYVPAKRGSLQPEMMAAARRAGRLPYRLPPSQDALLTEVAAGRPVLVLQNLGFPAFPRWHYAVVVGFDPAANDILLRSGTERRRRESSGWFFRSWERAGNWAFVALQPGDVPATAEPVSYIELLEQRAGLLADAELDRAYAAALERWPADALVVFAAATRLHRRGELAAAETQYRQLLVAEPGHVGARNNLAEILRERGCLEAARDEAHEALRYAGSDAAFREAVEDTLQSIARSTPANSEASACP